MPHQEQYKDALTMGRSILNFFLEFIQHFVKYVSCSQKNPVLMIFDGHKSHTKSLELIDYAR